jgi:hypothetical protein
MRTVLDIITELDQEPNEQRLGEILQELSDMNMSVANEWNDADKMWTSSIVCGNDLTYCGAGKTLAAAVEDALGDWFSDYDCE